MCELLKKITYKQILFFGIIIILILSLYNIAHLNMLVVIPDEFGYWANAALMAGKDWSGTTPISPYYSFGYSLILAPLFWLFSSTSMMYKAAIVMNTVFYIFAYLLSFQCFSRIFKDKSKKSIALLCSIVALYGANLFNVNIAWVEPFIYMLFWLSVYLLVLINENAKNSKVILFAFVLVYMYTVHQRALGVVVCGIFIMFILALIKKISIRQFGLFMLIVVLCFIAQIMIKNHIVSILWNRPISTYIGNVNDYGGQLSKVIDIMTSPVSFLKFIRGILSRYLYLIISSASIIIFGIIYVVKKFIAYIQTKKEFPIIEVYCFFCLLFSIAISSIYFYQSQRIDTIIYGRYSEFVMVPMLIFGLYYLLNQSFSFKQAFMNGAYILCVSILIYQYMSKSSSFLQVGTVNAAMFYNTNTYSFHIIVYICFGIIFCSLFYFLWTRKPFIFRMTSICMLIAFWMFSSYGVMEENIKINQDYASNMTQISEKISNIDNSKQIYFLCDTNPENSIKNNLVEILQYLLPYKNIQIIQKDELNNLEEEYYLVTPLSNDFDLTDYTVITQANEIIVVCPNDSNIVDKIDRECIIDEKMMYYEVNNTNIEGLVATTQNLALNKGTYKLYLNLEASNVTNQNIGYLQILSDQGEIMKKEIIYQEKNNYVFGFDFGAKYVNISFYSNGNAQISLKKLSYEKQ